LFFACRGTKGDISNHFKIKTFQRRHSGWIIGQQQNSAQAQLVQNLRTNTIVPIRSIPRFKACVMQAQVLFLHHCVSPQLVHQIQAVLALPQVENDAATCRRNLLE
jgi:hypothetical protein